MPLPSRSVPSDSAVRALDGTVALTPTIDWIIPVRSGDSILGDLVLGDSISCADADCGAHIAAEITGTRIGRRKSRGTITKRRFAGSPSAETMSRLHCHAHGITREFFSHMCAHSACAKPKRAFLCFRGSLLTPEWSQGLWQSGTNRTWNGQGGNC